MKIQLSLLLLFSLFLFSCPPQEDKKSNSTGGEPVTTVPPKETTPKPIPPFEMEFPKNQTIVNEASGDLDNDKIDEKIVVLNTGQSGDFGKERIILIFKAQDGAWKLWHRSSGAIMSSEEGGIMGDPFHSINVERGALVIKHFGGSSSKWDLTHRFRYQNDDWELIGATTINSYFTELETFDYNLTSGNVIYKKEEIEYGDGDKIKVVDTKAKANFVSKMKKLPLMDGFDFEKIIAVDPKTKKCYPPDYCIDYKPTSSNEIEIPKGYTLLKEASGDLNKDGKDEKVLVLNTGKSKDLGDERIIHVYHNKNGKWKLWHSAKGAVLASEQGGVFGDPFQSVDIERGAIVIKHFGGSRSKWDYTHRFKYQNKKWELIGATIINETPCEEQEKFDYNLTSGNVIYKYVYFECENGENQKVRYTKWNENFNYKMKSLPNMDDFKHESIYTIHPNLILCGPENNCNYAKDFQKIVNKNVDYNNGFEIGSMNNLQGMYMLGGHHQSWALDIQPKGNGYEVKYYDIDGMLPSYDERKDWLQDRDHRKLKKFDVNFRSMTFDSDLGKGKIRMTDKPELIITFSEIESHIDDQLNLSFQGSIDH